MKLDKTSPWKVWHVTLQSVMKPVRRWYNEANNCHSGVVMIPSEHLTEWGDWLRTWATHQRCTTRSELTCHGHPIGQPNCSSLLTIGNNTSFASLTTNKIHTKRCNFDKRWRPRKPTMKTCQCLTKLQLIQPKWRHTLVWKTIQKAQQHGKLFWWSTTTKVRRKS